MKASKVAVFAAVTSEHRIADRAAQWRWRSISHKKYIESVWILFAKDLVVSETRCVQIYWACGDYNKPYGRKFLNWFGLRLPLFCARNYISLRFLHSTATGYDVNKHQTEERHKATRGAGGVSTIGNRALLLPVSYDWQGLEEADLFRPIPDSHMRLEETKGSSISRERRLWFAESRRNHHFGQVP